MKGMRNISITSSKWNSGLILEHAANGRKYRKRIRNWYFIDSGVNDCDSFTWGYLGSGPASTAYSILRELFGKDIARAKYMEFIERFVSRVPEESALCISGDSICLMLGIGKGKR